MPLVLLTLMSFCVVGLVARRLAGPQYLTVVVIGAGVAIVQLVFPRFL